MNTYFRLALMRTRHYVFVRACILIVLMLLAMVLSPVMLFAQEKDGLTVVPGFHRDNVEPGQVYTHSVTVTNLSSIDRTYYLLTEDITGLDENNAPIFTETPATSYELSEWVELPSESIELKAGEARSVSFSVRVPKTATPGSHTGGIFFSLEPPKMRTIGTGVGIRVGIILSLRVAGEVEEELMIREFSTDKLVYGEAKVTFDTKVENLGNVLVPPAGFLEVTDMFGVKVANITLNEERSNIFPKSERVFKTVWEYDKLAFGRYQAVVSIGYGPSGAQRTIFNTTSFWVLPLKPLLTVLGILFGLFIVLYVSMRYYIRKKISEMSGGRRGDAELYARRYQKTSSPMTIVVLAGFIVVGAFLVLLFFMLA